jgi:hypothetical protein
MSFCNGSAGGLAIGMRAASGRSFGVHRRLSISRSANPRIPRLSGWLRHRSDGAPRGRRSRQRGLTTARSPRASSLRPRARWPSEFAALKPHNMGYDRRARADSRHIHVRTLDTSRAGDPRAARRRDSVAMDARNRRRRSGLPELVDARVLKGVANVMVGLFAAETPHMDRAVQPLLPIVGSGCPRGRLARPPRGWSPAPATAPGDARLRGHRARWSGRVTREILSPIQGDKRR